MERWRPGAPCVVTAHSDVLSWARACRAKPLEETEWLTDYVAQVQAGLDGADAVAAPTRWMMDALQKGFRAAGVPGCDPERRGLLQAMLDAAATAARGDGGPAVGRGEGHCDSEGRGHPMPVLVAGEAEHESQSAGAVGAAKLVGRLSDAETDGAAARRAACICARRFMSRLGWRRWRRRCADARCWRGTSSACARYGSDGALFFSDAASLSALLTRLAGDAAAAGAARRRSWDAGAVLFARSGWWRSYLRLFRTGAGEGREGQNMSRKLRIAYLAHSLRSDWNNGNAHFLRGLLRALGAIGHEVVAFERDARLVAREPADWSAGGAVAGGVSRGLTRICRSRSTTRRR